MTAKADYDPNEWWTVTKVSRERKCSKNTVRAWIDRFKIRAEYVNMRDIVVYMPEFDAVWEKKKMRMRLPFHQSTA